MREEEERGRREEGGGRRERVVAYIIICLGSSGRESIHSRVPLNLVSVTIVKRGVLGGVRVTVEG